MSMIAHVFGKEGCSKCAALKRRLERLLARPEYSMIKMEYHDVMTLDGIVTFCKAECLNPNRIPALLMGDGHGYVRQPAWADTPFDSSTPYYKFNTAATYPYVGVQTDYDNGGVIPPETIERVLKDAKAVAG